MLIIDYNSKKNQEYQGISIIQMLVFTNCHLHIKKYVRQLLIKQINPPPYLFFALFIIAELGIEIPEHFSNSLFIVGLLFTIAYKYNHFYFYSPILNSGIGQLSYVNMALAVLAANQKFKAFLLIFIVGQTFASRYSDLKQSYVVVTSFWICLMAYRTMPFKKYEDNRIFFAGFFTIGSYYVIKTIFKYTMDQFTVILIFLVPLFLLLGYQAFGKKIEILKLAKIQDIKVPEVIFHAIQIKKSMLQDKAEKKLQMGRHKVECNNPQCFCNDNQKALPDLVYVKSLYTKGLQSLNKIQNQFLFNHFIRELITQRRFIQATLLMSSLSIQCKNFFRWVQRQRNKDLLQKCIADMQMKQPFSQQYSVYFKYDKDYVSLVEQISTIITKKIEFFNQMKKQEPHLNVLQQKGCQIVGIVQDLHIFYLKNIKKIENITGNFIGSAKYALYLIGATNFRQQGLYLLKDMKRKTEQPISKHTVQYQELVFQSRLKPVFKKTIEGRTDYENEKQIMNFQLSVVNANINFLDFYKTKKTEIGNFNIENIIPDAYRKKHFESIMRIFNPKFFKDSKFIGKTTRIPIKISKDNNSIAQLKMIARQNDKGDLILVCIIRFPSVDSDCIITDLKGFLLDKIQRPVYIKKMLRNKAVFDTLKELEVDRSNSIPLKTRQIVLQQKINEGSQRFMVSISCPFEDSFGKEQEIPIHIEYHAFAMQSKAEKRISLRKLTYLRKAQEYQTNGIQQEQSTTSSNTQKQSAIHVLKKFTQTGEVSFFNRMKISYIAIILVCIVTITLQYFFLNLPWNNSDSDFNPIQNINTIFVIRKHIYEFLGFYQDWNQMKYGKLDEIRDFPFAYTFSLQEAKTALNSQRLVQYDILNDQITYKLGRYNQIFDEILKQYLSKDIKVINPSVQNQEQQITVKNLLVNYVADAYLTTQVFDFATSLMQLSFHQNMQPVLSQLVQHELRILNQTFDQNYSQNIIMATFLFLAIVLTIIPIIIVNRRKQHLNQVIFDILITVSCEQINNQMFKLDQVKAIIKQKYSQDKTSPQQVYQNHQKRASKLKTLAKLAKTPYQNQQQIKDREEVKLQNITINPDRRRPAQLDTQFTTKQKIFYQSKALSPFLVIFLFGIFLTIITYLKIQESIVLKQKTNLIFIKQRQVIRQNILLLNTKMLIDNGSNIMYENKTLDVWIGEEISKMNQQYLQRDYSYVIGQCQNFYQICLRKFSESVLEGIIKQNIRMAYFGAIKNDPNVTEYRRGLMYAETVLQAKYNFTKQKLNLEKKNLMEYSGQLHAIQFKVYAISCVWGVTSLVVLMLWITTLKNQYIKQAKIISFLNEQMVSSNKRIDSFLVKLSKDDIT